MKIKIRLSRPKIIGIIFTGFVIFNIFIIIHTYKFTHYSSKKKDKVSSSISLADLVFGIDIPRPHNDLQPTHQFETIVLECNDKKLNGWLIKTDSTKVKGTVLIAHGYNSSKAAMLSRATFFLSEGYDTFLLDFMGVGDSDGNTTTIGYKESENIKTAYDFLVGEKRENIILSGTSMGAVAIMKALYDYPRLICPKAIILECPFSTMLKTVKARFAIMNLPQSIAYPFTFWGGVINGFDAFEFNPIEYASAIEVPTLLVYGKNDNRVSMDETLSIFEQLNEPKSLKIYLKSDHDNFLEKNKLEWTDDVRSFLDSI